MYYIPSNTPKKEKDKKQKVEEQIRKIKALVDAYLTPEARQRLKFVELAHPEKALNAYLFLFHLIQSGQVRGNISEELVKRVLLRISQATKKEFKIKFK